jgi:hypothetical protein
MKSLKLPEAGMCSGNTTSSVTFVRYCCYDFAQLLAPVYIKRDPPVKQFIRQHADRPKVILLVILIPGDELWRGVEGRPTEGLPEFSSIVVY